MIAAKAVAFFEAAQPSFKDYAAQIVANAAALAEALAGHGLRLVSGGTDNHLMLVDLRTFDADLSGKKARLALDRAGISLNENTVPDDPRPPYITSGLRIGTPAVTTQGMGEPEMATIGALIHRVLVGRDDDAEIAAVRDEVRRPLLQVHAVPVTWADRAWVTTMPRPVRPSSSWQPAGDAARSRRSSAGGAAPGIVVAPERAAGARATHAERRRHRDGRSGFLAGDRRGGAVADFRGRLPTRARPLGVVARCRS